MQYINALLISFILSVLLVPLVKQLAIKIGAVDCPNERKVHKKIMPRLGGLAIYISFMIGITLFIHEAEKIFPIVIGSSLIVLLGILDDKYQLSAKVKFLGQIGAAVLTIFGGIQMEYITLFSGEILEFGFFTIPLTIFWIVGITNAINLIDGLDGLAAGVSSIALLTIFGLSISMGNYFVALISIILLGGTLGFLIYNFHPAKIFMGDTGSLFLGYMISVLSILGFTKSVTFFSLIIPIIILAIPIIDTLFAIVRRIVHNKPLSAPDKNHIHHSLMKLGYTHRQTVLIIYMMSGLFSLAAVLFTNSTVLGSILVLVTLLVLIELIVEVTGLISENYRPLLNFIRRK
ncbi:glycosyltransferase family 4 protein [Fervidibacillus halotolerans]|uniref:Undecaprenyl/decaprenyl-phosphate alpha-N-acetylglucosaminyl 1-phosphate transferase n=1 Tax=Fervidibacillus halotolerans TaxID=2980027 RepID=A0A9E8LZG6_9BACI|nr:MraY family glycosyltransferase [Fervidibacillus halotolerans]WAA12140.1 undecaprenyl/decaprenyl-phosphate alpha-N-acetylglucosaminyl 1-phosphate transferase [Fervidibacillus halotolerans]